MFGKSIAHHGIAKLVCNSNAGRAGSEDDHALIAQRSSADAQRGDGGSQGNRPGTLHVVVKGAVPVAILLEDTAAIAWGEVFPLQQRLGKQSGCYLDVGFNELVVRFPANSRMPIPDIHGIVQQGLAIRAYIEHYGNHTSWIDAASGRIDCELADGNFDGTHAPVANSKDLFGIGGKNQVDVVGTGTEVGEGFFNSFRIVDR